VILRVLSRSDGSHRRRSRGGIGGIGPPTFRTGGITPLFFRRVCNVLMVYYIRPSSSNCLSMHYDGTSGCSCNARFIKQTCAVRRDTERLMIGQSLSLIYAEGHTHTHAHSVGYNEIAIHYLNSI